MSLGLPADAEYDLVMSFLSELKKLNQNLSDIRVEIHDSNIEINSKLECLVTALERIDM